MNNRSMPNAEVIPELAYDDVEKATDWLCSTFNFSLRIKIADHRAQINIGTGAMVITKRDSENNNMKNINSTMVRIDNIDNHYHHVKQKGAKIISELSNYPYGERQYSVEDIGGHIWTFSQTLNDVKPEEWGGTSVNL